MRQFYISKIRTDFFEEELIKFYSLGGGVPRYLELLRNYENFASALQELVLKQTGVPYC